MLKKQRIQKKQINKYKMYKESSSEDQEGYVLDKQSFIPEQTQNQSLIPDQNEQPQSKYLQLLEHICSSLSAKNNLDFSAKQTGKLQLLQQIKNLHQESCQEQASKNSKSSQQQNQTCAQNIILDLRKMVSNSTFYPFNCFGKIVARFTDSKRLHAKQAKWGTAFLISPKHIMTAAHTLFFQTYCKETKKIKYKEAKTILFYPEPLFLDEQLQNGIQAQLKLYDQRFEITKVQKRGQFDWAVLEIHPNQKDYRTKYQTKYLKCDFDYNFKEKAQSPIIISGYPDATIDILTVDRTKQNQKQAQSSITKIGDEQGKVDLKIEDQKGQKKVDIKIEDQKGQKKVDIKIGDQKGQKKDDLKIGDQKGQKSGKIMREKQDIKALYFHYQKAHGQSLCKKLLHYHHSTSKGTSGAPLIIYDQARNSYKVIGIHIRSEQVKEKQYKVGLLLRSIEKRTQIQQMLKAYNKHEPIKKVASKQKVELDSQQISKLIQSKDKSLSLSHNIQCQYRNPSKCLQEITKNASKFPLLYFVESSSSIAKDEKDKISDPIFIEFAERGHFYSMLSSIKIVDSKLTDDSLISLFRNASRFPSLQILNFQNNQITGLKLLPQTDFKYPLDRLENLQLHKNKINNQGLKNLVENCKILPNMIRIILSQNSQITDVGLNSLLDNAEAFPNIGWINFNSTQVSDEGFELLCLKGDKLPNLKGFSFSATNITGEALKILANSKNFPKLQQIYMNYNKITDEGFQQLAANGHNFPNLKQIYMKVNSIADKGIKALVSNSHKFKSLQKLLITQNKITNQGFVELVDKIETFKSLLYFDLSKNQIDSDKWQKEKLVNERQKKVQYLKKQKKLELNMLTKQSKTTNSMQKPKS